MFNLENNFKPVLAAKTNRAIVISCLILQLASACSPKSETPQTNLSSPTPIVVTLTPTAKPKISAIIDSPYPTSQEGFNLNAGGADPEERIKSMGAGTDIAVMKGQYIAEMNRSGIEPDKTEFVFGLNELAASSSWTLMVRDSTGQFFWPKITTGPDAGMLERSGNLAKYLNRDFGDDYFDLIPLNFPKGLGKTEQRLVQDKSGWFVMGGFLKGEIVVWFDADKDEWIPANSFKPEGSEVVLEEDKWVAKVKGDVVSTFDPQKGEWVKKEVWDIKVVNFKENPDMRVAEIPTITTEDVTSGRWARRLDEELVRMGLDKQNVDPDIIKFGISNQAPNIGPYLLVYYDQIPLEQLKEMKNDWKKDPVILLFPALIQHPSGNKLLIYTERIAQKDVNNPYIFFNFLLGGQGNFSGGGLQSFLKFVDGVALTPIIKVNENNKKDMESRKKNGKYPYLWDIGVYGANGKAKPLLEALAKNGATSPEINKQIFIQYGFIGKFKRLK